MLCWGLSYGHFRMFSSIPGLHSLYVNSISLFLWKTKNTSRYCQLSKEVWQKRKKRKKSPEFSTTTPSLGLLHCPMWLLTWKFQLVYLGPEYRGCVSTWWEDLDTCALEDATVFLVSYVWTLAQCSSFHFLSCPWGYIVHSLRAASKFYTSECLHLVN